jgi:transposase
MLRESLSGLSNTKLIRQCAQLPAQAPSDITTAAVYTLQLLARRILDLTHQINDLKQRITQVLAAHAPQLLDHYGVGPDTASVLLIAAGDNPERLRSEASFAALCGVSPVEASSGKAQRRRLNQGGDRQANSAFTPSSCPGCAGTPAVATTFNDASLKARPLAKRSAA